MSFDIIHDKVHPSTGRKYGGLSTRSKSSKESPVSDNAILRSLKK